MDFTVENAGTTIACREYAGPDVSPDTPALVCVHGACVDGVFLTVSPASSPVTTASLPTTAAAVVAAAKRQTAAMILPLRPPTCRP